MILKEKFQKEGQFLFRYRSYLPLLMIPLLFIALVSFGQNLILSSNSTSSATQTYTYNIGLIIAVIVVGFLGQFIRILVAGYVPKDTSGRNTKDQKASVLNTTGMYSLCRNPLYLGNFLMMLSAVLLLGNWLFVCFFILAFWLYYERIIYAEEDFLVQKFGDKYLDWARNTPAFLPHFKAYKKASLDFSFKSMLKREYHSFFGMTSTFFILHYLIGVYVTGEFMNFEPIFTWLFVLSAVFYLVMLVLSKKTRVFEVDGR